MKEASYRFTQLAEADLEHIWDSIARDNPEAADRVVLEIYNQIKLLTKFPDSGHSRKDLAQKRSLLFFPIGKYMIAYTSQGEGLLVIRILHATRNIAAILREQQELS